MRWKEVLRKNKTRKEQLVWLMREENPELLRQYERVFEEDERALKENSSDDEYDEHVPRDWQNYNFSQLTINAGENVPWEYKENEVSVSAM